MVVVLRLERGDTVYLYSFWMQTTPIL